MPIRFLGGKDRDVLARIASLTQAIAAVSGDDGLAEAVAQQAAILAAAQGLADARLVAVQGVADTAAQAASNAAAAIAESVTDRTELRGTLEAFMGDAAPRLLAMEQAKTDFQTRLDHIVMTPGPDGRAGVDGRAGSAGRDGLPGRDGVEGVSGKDGLPGTAGKDGTPGTPGAAGKDGINGAKGDPGTVTTIALGMVKAPAVALLANVDISVALSRPMLSTVYNVELSKMDGAEMTVKSQTKTAVVVNLKALVALPVGNPLVLLAWA